MNTVLFSTLKRLIEQGHTEGLLEKIDVFYAVGSIGLDEYKALRKMLGVKA